MHDLGQDAGQGRHATQGSATPSHGPFGAAGATTRSTGGASGAAGRAVIVVNYGSSALLADHHAPLTRDSGLTAVVVDNPTDDTERTAVTALAREHGWRLVTPDVNTGFGGGMNLGVAAALEAGARSMLLLNPDAVITPYDADRLLSAAETDTSALVAPIIRTSAGTTWFAGSGVRIADGSMVGGWDFDEREIEPWLTGACLAISRELWERVGGFDPDYFLYWEDVDLSRRVREAGGRLVLLRDAQAVHDEGGTQGTGVGSRAKSDLYYYYNVRNRMLYARKRLKPAVARSWAASSPAAAREILLRGGRRQFLDSRSGLRAAARGLRDGLTWRQAPGEAGEAGVERPGGA